MENINAVNLPEPLPEETDLEYGFRAVQQVGALAFFSRGRDEVVRVANELHKVAATRPLTAEEMQQANDLHNMIIEQQGCVDAAWAFEQITETGKRVVN